MNNFRMSKERARAMAINHGAPERHIDEMAVDGFRLNDYQREAADQITPAISIGSSVLFRGVPGNGKTLLASSYIYGWYRRGCIRHYRPTAQDEFGTPGKARYWRMNGLLSQQKGWFKLTDTTESPFSMATGCNLLVLDELLPTHESVFDQREIRELLDVRYANKKATIVICNLSDDGLRNALDKATLDRFNDGGCVVDLAGKSLRGTK